MELNEYNIDTSTMSKKPTICKIIIGGMELLKFNRKKPRPATYYNVIFITHINTK